MAQSFLDIQDVKKKIVKFQLQKYICIKELEFKFNKTNNYYTYKTIYSIYF